MKRILSAVFLIFFASYSLSSISYAENQPQILLNLPLAFNSETISCSDPEYLKKIVRAEAEKGYDAGEEIFSQYELQYYSDKRSGCGTEYFGVIIPIKIFPIYENQPNEPCVEEKDTKNLLCVLKVTHSVDGYRYESFIMVTFLSEDIQNE